MFEAESRLPNCLFTGVVTIDMLTPNAKTTNTDPARKGDPVAIH